MQKIFQKSPPSFSAPAKEPKVPNLTQAFLNLKSSSFKTENTNPSSNGNAVSHLNKQNPPTSNPSLTDLDIKSLLQSIKMGHNDMNDEQNISNFPTNNQMSMSSLLGQMNHQNGSCHDENGPSSAEVDIENQLSGNDEEINHGCAHAHDQNLPIIPIPIQATNANTNNNEICNNNSKPVQDLSKPKNSGSTGTESGQASSSPTTSIPKLNTNSNINSQNTPQNTSGLVSRGESSPNNADYSDEITSGEDKTNRQETHRDQVGQGSSSMGPNIMPNATAANVSLFSQFAQNN